MVGLSGPGGLLQPQDSVVKADQAVCCVCQNSMGLGPSEANSKQAELQLSPSLDCLFRGC